MDLVTVPLELAKEAIKEATKEVTKEATKEAATEVSKEVTITADSLSNFGKSGNEIKTEHISLGKLGAGNGESEISFGRDNEDFFIEENAELKFGTNDEIDTKPDNAVDIDEMAKHDVLLEPQESFRGCLSACNYKCITSYCYPTNLAKGIGTKTPNGPNSKVGHT